MFKDEKQTTDADIDDESKGKGDATSEELDLAKLGEIAGREFKSVDDYKKHYENLASFVGKKDESGEKLKGILSKAEPFAAKLGVPAEDFLNFTLENPNATEDEVREHFNKEKSTKVEKDNAEDKNRLTKLEFLAEHPEAKEDFKLIDTLSKGLGVSYSEALESPEYKKMATANREKKGTSVINSNNRVATTSESDLKKARERAINTGRKEDLGAYLKQQAEAEAED